VQPHSSKNCSYLTPTKADIVKHIWDFHLRAIKQPANQFSKIKAGKGNRNSKDFKTNLEDLLLKFAQLHELFRSQGSWTLIERNHEDKYTVVCSLQALTALPIPTLITLALSPLAFENADSQDSPLSDFLSDPGDSVTPFEMTPNSPTGDFCTMEPWETCSPFSLNFSPNPLMASPPLKRRLSNADCSIPKRPFLGSSDNILLN